jgi:hypothetical protein
MARYESTGTPSGRVNAIARLMHAGAAAAWDPAADIDWSMGDDPAPRPGAHLWREAFASSSLRAYGAELWDRFWAEKQLWMLSQYLLGERNALAVTTKLALELPEAACRRFVGSQATEEARHVAAFERYATERQLQIYSAGASFNRLMQDLLAESRWDVVVIGLHVLIEGQALSSFRLAAATFHDPLLRRIIELVARDEKRHVSFGVLVARDQMGDWSTAEVRLRENFVLEAANLLSWQYRMDEVWARLGVSARDAETFTRESPLMSEYRLLLFNRIVHALGQIGLLTARVHAGLRAMDLCR